MIWFTCKQCGKRHGRPDETSGSLLFCECGQANRVPWDSTALEPPTLEPADARPSSRPAPRTRDPGRCLNHPSEPSETRCLACGEAFCAGCIVTLQGATLCGPCKNYRLQRLQRPPRLSGLALVALILGLVSGPLAFCLSMMPLAQPQGPSDSAVIFGLIGAVIPFGALIVGLLALREIDNNPQVGGRALAMTGTGTALLGLLWCLAIVLILIGREFVG